MHAAAETFETLAAGKQLDEDAQQQWRIARVPVENVRPGDFQWHETSVPEPADGQVLLKTLYLSLAPVMRDYMSGEPRAGEQAQFVGEIIHGRGVAQIVKSRHRDWREGQIVQGQIGWQTYKISSMSPQEKMRAMPDNGLSASHGLYALGITGLSAWAGLFTVGQPRPGERVVVSGAAGGVGALVTQMASSIADCEVIGIAGGLKKCDFLLTNGCTRAIDYKTGNTSEQIAASVGDGMDIFFDNVGGNILDACLDHLRRHARIVLCGSISEYTRKEPYRLPGYARLRRTDSQMRGFFVYNHLSDWDRAIDEISSWMRDGKLKPRQTLIKGFQHMPAALAGLYSGYNIGKQMCAVRGEPDVWD